MKIRWLCIALASLLSYPAVARAEELGTEIDLTTFGELQQKEQSSVWEGMNLEEVSLRDEVADRRFYISGMLGPSFAGLGQAVSGGSINTHDTLFAAGGAIGVAFERHNGRLRIETEGMGRSNYDAPFSPFPGIPIGLLTASNWSLMQNIWRDFMFTDRFGVYGGGGIGAGGYRFGVRIPIPGGSITEYSATASSAFAWQAGGGLIYQVTDRLTFDVGYRYFQIDPAASAIGFGGGNFNFAASELMFSLRLYEPFRRWTR